MAQEVLTPLGEETQQRDRQHRLLAAGSFFSLMAKLNKAQRTAKRIERLEQTKLILEEKIKTLQAGLTDVENELELLKKA